MLVISGTVSAARDGVPDDRACKTYGADGDNWHCDSIHDDETTPQKERGAGAEKQDDGQYGSLHALALLWLVGLSLGL